MKENSSLNEHLEYWSKGSAEKESIADILRQLSKASVDISRILARQQFVDFEEFSPTVNSDGDDQKALDVFTDEIIIDYLKSSPVGVIASEENEGEIVVNQESNLVVAMDPLDGSSNIENNASIGTIFSVLKREQVRPAGQPVSALGCSGLDQVAAGFFVYGPQTSLVLTLLNGTFLFIFDPEVGEYIQVNDEIAIVADTAEFSINSSNYRHWDTQTRAYIDDCIAGETGTRGKNFNMRWTASLVADAYRILIRGGVYLYPGDSRDKYSQGRLRMLYEAYPMALLIEQAGGSATDGIQHIVEKQIDSLHQRVPLVFGSKDEVKLIESYYTNASGSHHPLFKKRQLLRE
jgi:fructose-1,6-bisphosphatase I